MALIKLNVVITVDTDLYGIDRVEVDGKQIDPIPSTCGQAFRLYEEKYFEVNVEAVAF